MVKVMPVDVKASMEWKTANGRLAPADKKEVAAAKSKVFVCPNCRQELQKANSAFGETVMCECGGVMVERTSL